MLSVKAMVFVPDLSHKNVAHILLYPFEYYHHVYFYVYQQSYILHAHGMNFITISHFYVRATWPAHITLLELSLGVENEITSCVTFLYISWEKKKCTGRQTHGKAINLNLFVVTNKSTLSLNIGYNTNAYVISSRPRCMVVPKVLNWFRFIFLFLAQQPPVGQGLLIHEVSRSHTTTHHSR